MAEGTEDEFKLYEIHEANGRHTILKTPKSLPEHLRPGREKQQNVLNILMADVSGSMSRAWPNVVDGWRYIKDKLQGRTEIYVFSNEVHFIRSGTELREDDFKNGGTNLTFAFQTIHHMVENSTENFIRLFIVTDGEHNGGIPRPETVINSIVPPPGKEIYVFLLGITYNFPVIYSIDIRSVLHNGNANLPPLFWAKEKTDIVNQMRCIGEKLGGGLMKLRLNHEGCVLPGAKKTQFVHLGEWLYFPEEPEKMPALTLKINEEQPQPLPMIPVPLTINLLLSDIIRQWNSVLLQMHRKKERLPLETFGLMESIFKYLMDQNQRGDRGGNNSVKARLHKKYSRTYEIEFRTLMNQSKRVIGVEGKFLKETELAEVILKTTVSSMKFDMKNLRMKGHTLDNYMIDVEKFEKIYMSLKEEILQLEPPTPEECCRITMTSTIQDLQDPDFLNILEENKFEFLKQFTMTGIPVYAPIRDASQINPWTMVIKHILVTPFTVLSQRAIEGYAEMRGNNLGMKDKDVILQEGEESSRFNVIIPTVPAAATQVLKPLVRTNLFSLLTTFCILKNPHIIDYNAHVAALACAWVKSVSDYPLANRPEYVRKRLENLVATAQLYMDRKAIIRYVNVLISNPKQALMTESIEMYDNVTLKCEAMTKPMFYIHLQLKKFSTEQAEYLLKMMLLEFIGRCLAHYKADETNATPYTDFFTTQRNKEERKDLIEANCKEIIENFKTAHGDLLKKFFTLDALRVAVKAYVGASMPEILNRLIRGINIGVHIEKVEYLKNSGSCGDVMWVNFKSWAQEVGLPEDKMNAAFDPKQMFVYVANALKYRSSKDRLAKELPSYDDCYEIVKSKVIQESFGVMKVKIEEELLKMTEDEWRSMYRKTHLPLVIPLSPQQVVNQARAKGIMVTRDTLSMIYRYDSKLQLVRNACQIPGCPHYLEPHNNFNQHLSVERECGNFPHCLHVVSYDRSGEEVSMVVDEVVSAIHTGRQNRPKKNSIKRASLDNYSREIESLKDYYHKAINSPSQHPPPGRLTPQHLLSPLMVKSPSTQTAPI